MVLSVNRLVYLKVLQKSEKAGKAPWCCCSAAQAQLSLRTQSMLQVSQKKTGDSYQKIFSLLPAIGAGRKFIGCCYLELHKASGYCTLAPLKIQALPCYILTKLHFSPWYGMLKVPLPLVHFSVPVRCNRAFYSSIYKSCFYFSFYSCIKLNMFPT